jgi:NAD(P)-dependent dehydrogenase (short-subunit alcohol dehydrogenase family)
MGSSLDRDALQGRVAVVAGATRGAGRGIAAGLGEADATVICTGRSSVSGTGQSDYDRAETIEETADLVTQLGGTGIAIQVDHLDSEQVHGLAERFKGITAASTCWSTTSGAANCSKAAPLSGIPRSGNMTLTMVYEYCGWPLTLI